MQRVTNLRPINLEDLTAHYPMTLRKWRERFLSNLDKIRQLGHSDRFIRAREFYFSYCEAGFLGCHIGDFQLLFEKPEF